MFAQFDRQPDGSFVLTGTVYEEVSQEHLPQGRICLEIPDTIDVRAGRVTVGETLNEDKTVTYTWHVTPLPKSRRVSKTQVLGVLGPTLYHAWATSTDPVLMFWLAIFNAETSLIDVDGEAITQVITQAARLGIITAPQESQIQADLAELVK